MLLGRDWPWLFDFYCFYVFFLCYFAIALRTPVQYHCSFRKFESYVTWISYILGLLHFKVIPKFRDAVFKPRWASSNVMGIICPLVEIGLTDLQDSRWYKAHPAYLLTASLKFIGTLFLPHKMILAFCSIVLFFLFVLYFSGI
jgi:hypothetical protein